MKFINLNSVAREVAYVYISCPVRYGDEQISYEAPLRCGDCWQAFINVETGQIRDWPQGQSLDLCLKVCDEGAFALIDADCVVIAEHQIYYVPHCTIPGECGDYVELNIDANGVIQNWSPDGTFSGFVG
jgi:hypothetical protein